MKNILITGGAGFIGSNLCNFLIKKNYNIYVIDDLSIGKKKNIESKKIKFIKSNILNINKIRFEKKINIIIHLAAKAEILISEDKEHLYYKSNILGLQKVLNFANKNKIEILYLHLLHPFMEIQKIKKLKKILNLNQAITMHIQNILVKK